MSVQSAFSRIIRYLRQIPPSDMRDIPRYLEDELARIESTLSFIQEGNGIALTEAPAKPVDGMVVIADGVLWNPGFGPGLYKYNGTLALWEIFITSGTSNVLLLDDLSDADTTTSPPVVNDSLKWNGTNWVPYTPTGGVSTFIALTDTPSAYTSQALKTVRVNAGETALEFYTPSGGASPYWDDDGGSPVTLPSATGSKALALGDGTVAAAISSTVSGGLGNTIASGSNYAVVGGGQSNTITTSSGDNSVIVGGQLNNIYNNHSFIGSGYSNSNGGWYSVISGGYDNTIGAGADSAVISGGFNNTTTADLSTISGGSNNTVSSSYGVIGGGTGNTIAAARSVIVGGSNAKTTLYGQSSYASGKFSTSGSAQLSNLLARIESTDGTVTTLCLDGISALQVLPASTTWGFEMNLTARQTAGSGGTVGDSKFWTAAGIIKRDGSNNTVLVAPVTPTVIANDAGASAWTVTITADDTNEAFKIEVTGEVNKTIHWVANIRMVEVGV